MIITKTPFRISFCGGGSDMPDFYREYGGCVISTTINRYMYITIHPYFDHSKTSLRYSQIEIVDDIRDINHTIFKQVLNDKGISGVEISSTADVPSGTGLGSSSAFTVGLLHTLYCYLGKYVSKEEIACEACEVEIEKLGNPIGKQDQYAVSCGGLNYIEFHQDDSVTVSPLILPRGIRQKLKDHLVMYYTGITHDANIILAEQRRGIIQNKKNENLKNMCKLTRAMRNSLQNGIIDDFGRMLHEGWMKKKELAGSISSPVIDHIYDIALRNGALGGKLLGAGGGGFLLFFCPPDRQRDLDSAVGLNRFVFEFENDGTSIAHIGNKYW